MASDSGSELFQYGYVVYYNFENGVTEFTDDVTDRSQVVSNTEGEVVAVNHFQISSGDLLEMRNPDNDRMILCCILGAHAFRDGAIDAAKNYLRRVARWDGTSEREAVFNIEAMAEGSQVPGLYDDFTCNTASNDDSDATNFSGPEDNS